MGLSGAAAFPEDLEDGFAGDACLATVGAVCSSTFAERALVLAAGFLSDGAVCVIMTGTRPDGKAEAAVASTGGR